MLQSGRKRGTSEGDYWAGKMIHLELCKRLKIDQTDKWSMHKPETA